jgi:hypothetical protein
MLDPQQQKRITDFLKAHGLTFEPLLDEMIDHITCDIETHMTNGASFEEAFYLVTRDIPKGQLSIVQSQAISANNKSLSVENAFSYFGLVLMFVSVLFKMLHLQYGGVVLLISFASIVSALVLAVCKRIRSWDTVVGTLPTFLLVIGIGIFVAGYGLGILGKVEGQTLLTTGVCILTPALLLITSRIYRKKITSGNFLAQAIELHSASIVNFLLLLLYITLSYKVLCYLVGLPHFLGNAFLALIIFCAGLQFIIQHWRLVLHDCVMPNTYLPIMLYGLLLFVPFFTLKTGIPIRVGAVVACNLITAWLVLLVHVKRFRPLLIGCVGIVLLVFCTWAAVKLEFLPPSATQMVFNLPVLIILVAGLLYYRKVQVINMFMIISVSGYVLEYPQHL